MSAEPPPICIGNYHLPYKDTSQQEFVGWTSCFICTSIETVVDFNESECCYLFPQMMALQHSKNREILFKEI